MPTPKALFVLVHGTFANEAPWIQKEGAFSAKLKEQFGNDLELVPFNWNGKNVHEDRFSESEKLRGKLKEVNTNYKDHRKIIIAHSHGGNLALYALRDPEIGNSYELITLATPFLNYRARNFASSMETHKFLLTAFFGLFTTVLTCMLAMSLVMGFFGLFITNDTVLEVLGGLSAFFILIGTIFSIFPWFYKRLSKFEGELPGFVKSSDLKYSSHYKKEYRVLSIINNKDEIKRWFGLTTYIVSNLFNLYDSSFRFLRKLAIYCGGFLLVYVIIMAFLDGIIEADLQKMLLTQIVVGICVAPLVAFLSFPYLTFFIAFAFLLFKSNPAVYGWENIKYMMFLDFKPSIQPENVSDISVRVLPTHTGQPSGLKHSIYNDPRIFPIISAWVNKV